MIDSINSFDENDSSIDVLSNHWTRILNALAGRAKVHQPAKTSHIPRRGFLLQLIPSPNEKHPPNVPNMCYYVFLSTKPWFLGGV